MPTEFDVAGERGMLVEILAPSPDRIPAICQYDGICGGCAVQGLAPLAYAQWKRDLVINPLQHARVMADVAPLVDALIDVHGAGRRRATFHARFDAKGRGPMSVS